MVLFFYPKDFTFVCPTEIIAFSDRVEEFRKINTELIACSCDTVESHLAWIKTPRKKGGKKEETLAINNVAAGTTLGDIDALAELKAKMEKGE